MDTSKLNDWLQLAASVGVVLSLIFVGLEIQQSRQIAIADVYQQRTALVMHAQTAFFTPQQWYDAFDKQQAGEEITWAEEAILDTALSLWFSYHENSHFQNQMGLLSDEHWETAKAHIRFLMEFETSRIWWEATRDQHRDTFASDVDQIIREIL